MTTEKQQHTEFLLRRLHSLTGVLPLAGFVVFHLFMNSYSQGGSAAFNKVVDGLRNAPYIHLISWGLLIAPFLFHIILGVWIVYTAKQNTHRQAYARNWAFFMQRITAVIILVFVVFHYISVKYRVIPENGVDYYAAMRAYFQEAPVYWFYVVALAATAFHLANGICTFCMTWGITISRTSQRAVAGAMTAAGIAIFVMGLFALNGFLKYPPAAPYTAVITDGAPAAAGQ